MQRDELPVDDTRQREVVERVHKDVVYLLVVFIQALGPEVEEACHLAAFVVAPQERDVTLITKLHTYHPSPNPALPLYCTAE